MNKSAIQKFAIWARTELIAQVSQRAYQYGITADGYGDANAVTVGGRALSSDEQRQRKELVEQIRSKGYTQVMEEVAYTWFNRFIALRFMEVNNYLPSHIRVFSDNTGAFKPEILNDVLHLDLPCLKLDKVAEYIENNQTEDLYRYLLLTQCNALNEALPQMFERMGGFTELLLPNNILRQDSVLGRMVTEIPEEDWTDQVQIIGWLYQYYNTELKDDTFALLKNNVKITKERIPSATQLFTPDWIVRYMVENSLGRLWIEGHPNAELKAEWKYYLDEAEQEAKVLEQLEAIRAEHSTLKPQDIKVIDPCMGSGHILVYAFDVLVQIYKTYGISERDAAQSILENNLYGLDIDDRAAQLAYFAVMMKARQYDRRIFSRGIQPHVYSIAESNQISRSQLGHFGGGLSDLERNNAANQMAALLDALHDAKEYGSILNVETYDWGLLRRFAGSRTDEEQISFETIGIEETQTLLLALVEQGEIMAQKYDVVVTNPPYMGASGMSGKLSEFVKKSYPDSKSDLFAVFVERAKNMLVRNGYQAMITMESWMFLSSFEKLRYKINSDRTIINMVHMPYLGKGGTSLGINFGTAAFIMQNKFIPQYTAQYEYTVYYECNEDGVPFIFPTKNERWKTAQQSNFSKIPGSPVAYWLSENLFSSFSENYGAGHYMEFKKGMSTGDNARFIRYWYEVGPNIMLNATPDEAKQTDAKWFPINSGGEFRKWYGCNYYVANWENDGFEMKANATELNHGGHWSRYIVNTNKFFHEGLTWNAISSASFGARLFRNGFLFSSASMCGFGLHCEYILALLNSCVSKKVLEVLSPTLNFGAEQIRKVPCIFDSENTVELLSESNVALSQNDWDSFETSWDFKKHPLV